MNITDYIDTSEAIKFGMFVLAGITGMIYAYYRKWSFEMANVGLIAYMFGDAHATGRALTTFLAMCAGAGGLSYLDTLTTSQIVIAGGAIGLMVPQTVDKQKKGSQ